MVKIKLNFDYDKLGNRKSMVTPYGVFLYNYDNGNRLTSLTNHKQEQFSFTYDSASRLTEITRPGSKTNYTFDANSFLTGISHSKLTSSIINSFLYSRDSIGNRTSITSSRGIASYSYDAESQLKTVSNTEITGDYANESFNYDSLGNRLNDQLGSYSYDANSQRLTEDFKYLYFYDNNGNMSSRMEKLNNSNVTNYTYNSENQLVKIEVFENSSMIKTSEYFFDALGRRIRKKITDHQDSAKSYSRKFIYDGQEILAELDEDNTTLAVFTHSTLRTDDVLAVDVKDSKMASQTGSYFYLKDALGSIIDIVDNSGNLKQHYVYSSFGKIVKISDASEVDVTENPIIKTNYGFTNREYDEESGLMYYRARFYMPEIGRFLQEDPHPGKLTDPITLKNKFTYVSNNPINGVDPLGLFTIKGDFGREIGNFFSGSGGYAGDLIAAAVVFTIIVASGGTAIGALAAIGSVAGGAALAAGLSTAISGGSFDEKFHSFFRVGLSFLGIAALAAPGGISSVGGNGLQGYVVSKKAAFVGYSETGLTIGSAATYNAGGGTALAGHEFGHTLQFIGIAALNSDPKKTWEIYGAIGAFGTIPMDGYNPVENLATALGH
jgi:RHS repeat-associated protein